MKWSKFSEEQIVVSDATFDAWEKGPLEVDRVHGLMPDEPGRRRSRLF